MAGDAGTAEAFSAFQQKLFEAERKTMNRVAIAATATAMLIGAGAALATTSDQPKADPGAEIMNPMIAGQAMLATRDIADNIANSPDHTSFVHDLKESGVDGLLKG